MSRKHFVAIAAALRVVVESAKLTGSDNVKALAELAVNTIATACAGFNGSFDRGRFVKACGL